MNSFLSRVDSLFNSLEHFWEHKRTERIAANILIIVFLGMVSLIELRHQGWLPEAFAEALPSSHYYAINIAFSMLLGLEVLGLVFSLANSVADSVGKQFEILSLILLRQSFKEFIYFNEPLKWSEASKPVLHILSDAGGGLLVFLLLGLYYKLQQHRAITLNPIAAANFIASKKLMALLLLVIFTGIGIMDAVLYLTHEPTFDFFATFYTILVFSDVLLVLVSLRYSSSYQVVFRNSGFAVATVVVRLALTAPPYLNVLLGVGAVVFALGITVAYNRFEKNQIIKTVPASLSEKTD
ncbi:MAG: hypothetical protein HGB19_02615 [Chlorobiales bacterium]|jgi:hypothetical protein|nr:hypothetical protein [Chlorobiales bacterium]